jgi:flagellar hook-associated protein 1 FlgK
MSITSIFNIAKSGLFAQQTAMQVSSNNIANVNTPGYARQEVVLTVDNNTAAGLLGNGVTVASVRSCYDRYLESSLAQQRSSLEEQKTYAQYFGRVERILDENNTKLTSNMVAFFNSWQDLSADPLSVTSRTNVATAGANLGNGMRSVYSELKGVQTEVNNNVAQQVSDINDIVHSIAKLNNQVYSAAAGGGQKQAFINQRSQLVDQLSGMIDIQTFEDQYEGMMIMTSGGRPLVDREIVSELKAEKSSTNGTYRITWSGGSLSADDITDTIHGGSLKSLIDLRDNQISGFISTIDDLAQSLMTQVNEIHSTGYNANGTNNDFFKKVTQDFAANLDISDEIKADPNNISVTSSAANPSNNDIALAIANLGNASVTINGRSTTYVDYGSSIASKIGSLSQNAQSLSEYHQDLMTSIEKQRDSISGVSIDEEMTNLIKFQYAYQAAARLINTADALFSSLMEIGR